jgi:hypothetical protein
MSSIKALGVSASSLARALALGSFSHEWEWLPKVQRWIDGVEPVPEGVYALAVAIRKTEVPPAPADVDFSRRQQYAEHAITPVLDEVARGALAGGWQPQEIARVSLIWAATVAFDLLGQGETDALVAGIRETAAKPGALGVN